MSDRTAAVRNAGLLAGLVLLAGCGGGDGSGFSKESATDILTASTDMGAVTSLHIAGDVNCSGQQVHFDLALTTAGDCQGTFTIGKGSAQILAVGGHSWMKPDHAFWYQEARPRPRRSRRSSETSGSPSRPARTSRACATSTAS